MPWGSLGIKKGDRVGVHLPTCPQYVIAYHAVLHLGAIVVNLNPMYTAEELKALAQNTGITTLFTFDMVLSNIRSLCGDVEIPRVIVTRVTDYINGFQPKHSGRNGSGKRLASFLFAPQRVFR